MIRRFSGLILFWNRSADRLYGFTEAEACGQVSHTLLRTEFSTSLSSIEEILRRDHVWAGELRHTCKDDRQLYVESRWTIVPEEEDLVFEINRDISERREAELGRHRVSELYRRLLDSSTDCIKLLGLDGKLLSINENGRRQLGIDDVNTVLGARWLDFWTSEKDRMASTIALQAAARGEVAEFEGVLAVQQGEPHWWHVAVSPVLGLDHQPEFLLAVSRNITERKHAEECLAAAHADLQRVASELKRSNEDLDGFARVAGHDLRAPLNTIVRFSQLLRRCLDDGWDEEARDCVNHIIDGGRHMSQLLTDLLTYSVLTQGSEKPTSVSLNDACSQATDNLTTAIQDGGATVHCDMPPSAKVRMVNGQLVQLFQNLIDNGIKYRRPNVAPVIYVSVEPQGEEWLITVMDNGLGIEKQYWESIFEPFRRLHGADVAGSGIGLATCRRVVERCGGKIWIKSVPGDGSTFQVLLPQVAEERLLTTNTSKRAITI